MTTPNDNPPEDQGKPVDPNQPQVPPTQHVNYNPLNARLPEKVVRGIQHRGPGFQRPAGICDRFYSGDGATGEDHRAGGADAGGDGAVPGCFAGKLRRVSNEFRNAAGVPKPQQERQPSAREIYDDLKLSEDLMSGAVCQCIHDRPLADGVSSGFSDHVFSQCVAFARVYISASRVPQLIDTVSQAMHNAQRPPGGLPPGQTMPPALGQNRRHQISNG